MAAFEVSTEVASPAKPPQGRDELLPVFLGAQLDPHQWLQGEWCRMVRVADDCLV